MAERTSGPVKPPVIDLKARDASAPEAAQKAPRAPRRARPEAAAGAPAASEPLAGQAPPQTTEPAASPSEPLIEVEAETPKNPAPKASQPPREAEPPRPATPRRQASLAMPWSAISIAAAAGAVLGTLLTYGLAGLLALPSPNPLIADPAPRLEALEQQRSQTETSLVTIEAAAAGNRAAIADLATRLTSATADLETRLAAAEANLASAPAADLTPLATRLDELESRVSAMSAGASSADAAALAETLTGLETSLATLGTRLDAAEAGMAALTTLRADLDNLRASVAEQSRTLAGTAIAPAVRLPLLVSGLESAFAAGRPFTAELQSLKGLLPDLAVPAELSAAAADGLARPDAVIEDFRAAIPAILAGRAAQGSGDLGQDALEWMKALLALRPSGEVEGSSPDAIVARLEAAVERRDFVAAASLLNQLPQAMQAAAGDVAGAIRAHASAEGFIAALRAQALDPSAEAAQ